MFFSSILSTYEPRGLPDLSRRRFTVLCFNERKEKPLSTLSTNEKNTLDRSGREKLLIHRKKDSKTFSQWVFTFQSVTLTLSNDRVFESKIHYLFSQNDLLRVRSRPGSLLPVPNFPPLVHYVFSYHPLRLWRFIDIIPRKFYINCRLWKYTSSILMDLLEETLINGFFSISSTRVLFVTFRNIFISLILKSKH